METTNEVIFNEDHVYVVLDEYDRAYLIGDYYECTRFISMCKRYGITVLRDLRVVELKFPTTLTIK